MISKCALFMALLISAALHGVESQTGDYCVSPKSGYADSIGGIYKYMGPDEYGNDYWRTTLGGSCTYEYLYIRQYSALTSSKRWEIAYELTDGCVWAICSERVESPHLCPSWENNNGWDLDASLMDINNKCIPSLQCDSITVQGSTSYVGRPAPWIDGVFNKVSDNVYVKNGENDGEKCYWFYEHQCQEWNNQCIVDGSMPDLNVCSYRCVGQGMPDINNLPYDLYNGMNGEWSAPLVQCQVNNDEPTPQRRRRLLDLF